MVGGAISGYCSTGCRGIHRFRTVGLLLRQVGQKIVYERIGAVLLHLSRLLGFRLILFDGFEPIVYAFYQTEQGLTVGQKKGGATKLPVESRIVQEVQIAQIEQTGRLKVRIVADQLFQAGQRFLIQFLRMLDIIR